MKLKISDFLVPALIILTSWSGSQITSSSMTWYDTLTLPAITPPGWVIGLVWTTLFVLLVIAMIMYFRRSVGTKWFWFGWLVLVVNLALNFLWSYLFFGRQMIGTALAEALVLALSVLGLIILAWPKSKLSSLLLLPYLLWVLFASFLTYNIWVLNGL